MSKIKAIKHIGQHQTYDLEIDHPDHQFYLANGLLTSNSHSDSYAYISYQCAHLFYYYPTEWMCAVLANETTGTGEDKQKAISLAKTFGFDVQLPTINKSSDKWVISGDKTIVAPLTFIKSVGETAVPFLVQNAPYKNIESLIFNDNIDYRKVNKRVLASLALSGALNDLIDARFDNHAHFYNSVIENRPKTLKKLEEQIKADTGKFKPFDNEQIFLDKSRLLGFLDIDLLIPQETQQILISKNIPSISDFDIDYGKFCWGYVNSFEDRLSKSGNKYIRLGVLGPNFDEHEIYLFGGQIESMKSNKCALFEIAKSIGPNRWNIYQGKIRWIG